eukprot:766645-Hanusia_phi.AAC.7
MSVVVVNEFAYMFGGINVYGKTHHRGEFCVAHSFTGQTNTMYMLNLRSFVWTLVSSTGNVPIPRHGHCMVAVGALIYMFGGTSYNSTTSQFTYLQDLHTFNINTNAWVLLDPTGATPSSRAFFGMAAMGNAIFVFGGEEMIRGKGLVLYNDMYKFDTSQVEWNQLKNEGQIPSNRSEFGFVAAKDQLLLYSGKVSTNGRRFEFNSSSNIWTFTNDAHPRVLESCAMSALANELYVVGGSGSSAVTADPNIYDSSDMTWTVQNFDIGKIVYGRQGHVMAAVGDFLYVYGGYRDSSSALSTTSNCFTQHFLTLTTLSLQ